MKQEALAIRSVTPNPSSGFVSVRYLAPARGEVRLDICRPGGELSTRLVHGHHEPGEYTACAAGLQPGRYVCVLSSQMGSVAVGFEVLD